MNTNEKYENSEKNQQSSNKIEMILNYSESYQNINSLNSNSCEYTNNFINIINIFTEIKNK